MKMLLASLQSKILDAFGRFLCKYLRDHVFKYQHKYLKSQTPRFGLILGDCLTLLSFRALSLSFAFHGFMLC